MKCLGLVLIVLAISFSSSIVYSQEGRPLKPFQQWSKKEAEKVLEGSPWAAKQEVRLRYADTARRIAGGTVPSRKPLCRVKLTSAPKTIRCASGPVSNAALASAAAP